VIKSNDIITEINKLLVKAYPIRTVYINLCPKDFDRPSFLIQCVREICIDVNRWTVQITGYYTVVCFENVNDYHNSDSEALLTVQNAIMDLFRDGYIQVGDRIIKCKSSNGGINDDASFIDVQVEYFDDRTDKVDTTPLMGTVTTNIKEG
jgi:hypothetical protein